MVANKLLIDKIHMKKPVLLLLASALLAVTDDLPAQGTAFTYQGRLQNAGTPATGSYDFTFSLFNTNGAGGVQVGDTLTNLEVGVTNGLFTVALDFGPVWTGNPAWLAIGVRTNGDAGFQPLAPLQALTPAPYSIYSENAATVTGPIAVAQLPTALVTNGESSVALTGSFAGNGGGLTNLNPGALLQGIVVVTNVYTPGGTYTFPVPLGVTQMTVKLWGAGGGASGYTSGGGGAFSEVTEAVTAGQTYVVVVGQNGDAGGGAGANDASGGAGFGDGYGGNGGQGSSLFLFNRPAYIMQAVAGGGGGGDFLMAAMPVRPQAPSRITRPPPPPSASPTSTSSAAPAPTATAMSAAAGAAVTGAAHLKRMARPTAVAPTARPRRLAASSSRETRPTPTTWRARLMAVKTGRWWSFSLDHPRRSFPDWRWPMIFSVLGPD